MSNFEQYRTNLDMIAPIISRNRENIKPINFTSFWINDVEQDNHAHIIEISEVSQKQWLKFEQNRGNECTLFPIDGIEGVFIDPPPVNNIDDFQLNGKNVGACDFLIVNENWLFAELKVEATSQKIEQIQENRTKASLQLARTLTYFKEKLPNSTFKAQNCSCLIVTPAFFPKISKIPMAMTLRFLKQYKVKLEEITLDETRKL